jgi:hypothetical protein
MLFLDEDQSVTLGYYFIYIDTHARAMGAWSKVVAA